MRLNIKFFVARSSKVGYEKFGSGPDELLPPDQGNGLFNFWVSFSKMWLGPLGKDQPGPLGSIPKP